MSSDLRNKLAKLVETAPDLAQPMDKFAYQYQQWLAEVEALLRVTAEPLDESRVIEWELQPESSKAAGDGINLVRRDGFKGRRWAITQRGYVLNKEGDFEYEPIPSSRTEEWLETVRWATVKEAIEFWRALARGRRMGIEEAALIVERWGNGQRYGKAYYTLAEVIRKRAGATPCR